MIQSPHATTPETARVGATLARWLSIVLHPFVVFAGLALLASWQLDRGAFARTITGVLVVVGVVWAFVLQRKRSGRWTTVDASRKHERPLLYGVIVVLLAGYWWWLGGSASAVATGVLVIAAMLCVAAALNRWIKLSLHMASLSFAGIGIWALSPIAGAIALALLPVLAWARLRMARHSGPEILGGVVLGAAFALLLRVAVT